jgi:hypothetical protein
LKKQDHHKYVEDKTEAGPGFEQKRWEEEHLSAALLKFGARDAKVKNSVSDLTS